MSSGPASLQVEEATVVMEDDAPAEPAGTPGILRNLSAWSIRIPTIDSCEDEAKREKIPVFRIDVERNDRREGEGCVEKAPAGGAADSGALKSRCSLSSTDRST